MRCGSRSNLGQERCNEGLILVGLLGSGHYLVNRGLQDGDAQKSSDEARLVVGDWGSSHLWHRGDYCSVHPIAGLLALYTLHAP